MRKNILSIFCLGAFTFAANLQAREYHVATNGSDTNSGTRNAPFCTIQHAADLAQPGDLITVHGGIYRERIDPPRGGTSEDNRVTYQAAPGETVVITGSEPIKDWARLTNDTWQVTIPNSFFGSFNPFSDRIHGDWCSNPGGYHPGAVYINGSWLIESTNFPDVLRPSGATGLWCAKVDGANSGGTNTTIWAQFPGVNPNQANVEINVRPTVFTPSKTGINYLTVRGFTMRDAAPPWAPPTAAQIGILSAYWCKGWIIESNNICYSPCCGIALGKYGDEFDNTSANTAGGYVSTLTRALTNGWNKATVGSHLIRNNEISHCEQTGIVGSLGCSFSTVTGNTIHDIHIRNLYGGAEMAGIKFHGAIDVVISHNHIYRCGQVGGIWLDWMAQGCQVIGNLLHDNRQDIFFEMQHGPILVANNLCLSPSAFGINSQGIAFGHNLIAGRIASFHKDTRITPFQRPHSTALAGMYPAAQGDSGDDRFYNNLCTETCNLQAMNTSALPCFAAGNVFTKDAQPSKFEKDFLLRPVNPGIKLVQKSDGWYLTLAEDPAWRNETKRQLVTTEMLGEAKVSNCAYDDRDGSPVRIDTDYFGNKRDEKNPFPGPFENPTAGEKEIQVWPISLATNRWERDIRIFEASDRTNLPPMNAVLFTGASNIRLWKNMAAAFPGHRVFNRGFGGAEMSDLVEFASRIVIPYHPGIVIIYAGDNDLADHKTPEDILAGFHAFAQEVHAALPATVVGCIAVKPSPSRARLVAQVKETDSLLESFCRTNANTIYIDDLTPMLNAAGGPRPELFGKDGLHLNEQGRAIWTSLIRPILDRYDPPKTKTSS